MALRQPITPALPLVAVNALTDAVVALHAPHMLARGGPYQRSLNLVARGADLPSATAIAAKQGKGHVAELAQAAGFIATAAVLGRSLRAQPNSVANDPHVDVEVLRRHKRTFGAQLKVGSASYVERAVRAGKYEHLVVNSEALEILGPLPGVSDRIRHRGVVGPQVVALECHATAADVLERMLLEQEAMTAVDSLSTAARAGADGALVSFALSLVGQIGDAIFRGSVLNVPVAVNAALTGATRAAARSGLEAWILLQRFVTRARPAFSSRLLQRIAGSRVVVSAIAEVVVETAIDLVDVLRSRMSFEDLLRRFGVHVATAAGAAVGASLALSLTRRQPWWLGMLAAIVGGDLGSRAGRSFGQACFFPRMLPA